MAIPHSLAISTFQVLLACLRHREKPHAANVPLPKQQRGRYLNMSQSPHERGYAINHFEGKQEQLENVCKFVREKGFLPADLVEAEVTWFYQYVTRSVSFNNLLETWASTTCTLSLRMWRPLRATSCRCTPAKSLPFFEMRNRWSCTLSERARSVLYIFIPASLACLSSVAHSTRRGIPRACLTLHLLQN